MRSIIHITFLAIALLVTVACDRQQPPETSSATSFVASSDGARIAYDVAGDGEPAVVFVHCWSCNRSFWDAQLEYFAPKHTVVRLDLAGHGKSGRDRKQATVKGFSEDVVAVVNDLGLRRILLVGHSMGGPVSIETASRLGDRVLGVVAVDSFYTPFPIPKTDAEAAAFLEPFAEDFADTSGRMLRSMFVAEADPAKVDSVMALFERTQTDEVIAIQALEDVLRWYRFDKDERLASLGGRLHHVNAALPADEEHAQEGIVWISGVGHFIPQMKPVEFN